ncbi:MAG: glycosyltransferase family 2 protein [Candidatus Omnitrophota bacterium]|nr:glycosyltransferase family 2 protein [Candidatus Omnitrophota bacterium]
MAARKDNTIAVMPSYNESRTIGAIVRDIANLGVSVLVIDDGSSDSTERIALDAGAMVMRNRKNFGKGFSVREGIKYVLKKTNFEWMIIMDADGQHPAEDIPVLMEATRSGDREPDIVIGNRMHNTRAMPPLRYLTNRFMSWVLSGICGQYIPDTQCGFRIIKVRALERLRLTSKKYDIDSEMLMDAAARNMIIRSVPVQTIYGEETSRIKPVRDTVKFLSLIIKHRFNKG